MLQSVLHSVSINDREDKDKEYQPQNHKKSTVMLRTDGIALHCQKQRSRDSADARDHQKSKYMHGAQTQEVAQRVFGDAGDEEENKCKKGSMTFYEVLEFPHELLSHKPVDKGHSQAPGDQESKK